MAIIQRGLYAMLIFQACASAAPRDITKLEDVAQSEQDVKLDNTPNSLLNENNNENKTATQGQRQKRFYNHYGYGFPPMSPLIYPNYFSRDEAPNPGGYGYDDPLTQIYKRLQDIAVVVRQPNLPPPPPPPGHFPVFFPVIYIPQVGCACTPNQNIPPVNGTTPVPPTDISNRFPEMEDERQNWGFVINETEVEDGLEEDFTRPISFDPIKPNRTMTRPPPSVEHGSSQSGATGMNPAQTTTTIRPTAFPSTLPPPSLPPQSPSACDGAVLSCCHQPQVTYDCFAVQGCPDPSSYGNPCDPIVILRVIELFQRFYSQRTG